jgi:hypothetical protein
MAVSLSSPVTGGAQTGFTSPTYTVVADIAPDVNGKQWAVTALGGTQTGASIHSVAQPFTWTYWKPKVFRVLGKPNPTTGLVTSVPVNVHKIVVRKGVLPLAGQPFVNASVEISIKIPAGSDVAGPAELRAMLSCAIGGINQVSAGIGDTAISGIV